MENKRSAHRAFTGIEALVLSSCRIALRARAFAHLSQFRLSYVECHVAHRATTLKGLALASRYQLAHRAFSLLTSPSESKRLRWTREYNLGVRPLPRRQVVLGDRRGAGPSEPLGGPFRWLQGRRFVRLVIAGGVLLALA